MDMATLKIIFQQHSNRDIIKTTAIMDSLITIGISLMVVVILFLFAVGVKGGAGGVACGTAIAQLAGCRKMAK